MVKSVSFKEFVSFLKNNNVYKQFRKGLFMSSKDRYISDTGQNLAKSYFSQKVTLTNNLYYCILGYAFRWKDTKEGHDFWENVRHRWENEYDCWN